jgi:hypothetical protein
MGTRKSQPVEQRMTRTAGRTRAAERVAHEAEIGTRPGDLMQLALGFVAPPAGASLAARPTHLPPSACPTAASAGGGRAPRRARGAEEASASTPARAARSGPLSKHATTAALPAARPALSRVPAGRAPSAVAPVAPRDSRERPGLGTASASMQRHFGELREALEEGWEIVQPIFARPLWSAPDDSATAFNFVLRSPRGTRLITVPQGRPVERFIRDRHLTVDYAR